MKSVLSFCAFLFLICLVLGAGNGCEGYSACRRTGGALDVCVSDGIAAAFK